MGFWRSFFGLEENVDDKEEGKKSNMDTTFVTTEEETEFSSSMFGKLELLDADVDYIEEVLPEKGENLRKQIELLRNLLLVTNNENDFEVQKAFANLETSFEESRREADGEYTLKRLEEQIKLMDSMFEKSIKNDGITKSKLDDYIEYIKKIQEKVSESDKSAKPILQNVKRQKFNELSMRAEYRIKMLELMYLLDIGDVDINPFKGLSTTKQKMFSKYFFEDAKNAAKQYEYLSYSENIFNKTAPYYFDSIDKMAERLNSQMEDAVIIEDFSIMELFDSKNPSIESFDFLKKFINFKSTMNEMRDKKDDLAKAYEAKLEKERKQQEEQEKALREAQDAENARQEAERQKEEKYKTMTDEEINAGIDEIEHDLKATGSRYVNILEFQKKIARARGLLTGEDRIQSDDLIYKTMNTIQVIDFIKKSKENGVNYTILPDSQEFDSDSGNYLIVVSQSDKDSLNFKLEEPVFQNLRNVSGYKHITFGEFPAWIINLLSRHLKKSDEFSQNLSVQKGKNSLYELSYYQRNGDGRVKKREKEVYEELKNILKCTPNIPEIGEKDLKDVMCYIEIPTVRNMIPILEQFKKANVTAFLEPVPKKKRNTNSRDNIHIYFRRGDLNKIESKVLPEISGPNKGIVSLRGNEIDFSKESARMSTWSDEKDLKEL